ncbi:peptidoglycan/LPS O-acetylase OafA/YrhL [Phyllobacterium sp. 1468]|uniref:acyltransferase family protein n=1 Tax=Phyllobacterium sp. 1468 TaxID=2817759 RepID=UPI0028553731|nr:acyltransferase [Phyllobacterium sp. 1468]MDR6632330.1 peptidoglycan/LPS O-acetylase OafA/YrhL [Phyllobacterium sp. 1468]
MGYYRLILAFMVLYSHAVGPLFGWNIGVFAVISFFVISGYVMALLVNKRYPATKDVFRFYLDRALRLFPQYLLYASLTLICVALLGLSDHFLSGLTPLSIVMNMLLLPLGYFMFGLDDAMLIPPAWSLGLELTFYAVFPLFWALPRRFQQLLVCGSIGVFALAVAGMIHSDWFGYRLIPGTFFMFIVGTSLAFPEKFGRAFPAGILLLAGMGLAVVVSNERLYAAPYNKEVLAGLITGIIAVSVLRKFRFGRIDEFLGNLSYGVFLNHYLLVYIAHRFEWSGGLFIPVVSLGLSFLSYRYVERYAIEWRHKIRSARAASSSQTDASQAFAGSQ